MSMALSATNSETGRRSSIAMSCYRVTILWKTQYINIYQCIYTSIYITAQFPMMRGVQKLLQFNMTRKWQKQNFYAIIQQNHTWQQCICHIHQKALWQGKKGKGRYSSSCEPHLRAMGCHLSYGTTQCYLSPYTSERAPPNPSHVGWYSIYLPWRDGRLSWPSWLDSAPAKSWTSDLLITSPTPNHMHHQDNQLNANQIERFLLHALQVWLRGLLDLVIIFEPCSCSAGCTKGHWIGTAVTFNLLTRSGIQRLLCISSSSEVVPQWQ